MSLNLLNQTHLKTPPQLISLFSGCGGIDLRFHYTGFEIVWAINSNFYACQTFKKNIADVIGHN